MFTILTMWPGKPSWELMTLCSIYALQVGSEVVGYEVKGLAH